MKTLLAFSFFMALSVSVIALNNPLSETDEPVKEDDGYASGTVRDIDGNMYQTILIGDQEWMAENLKVTRYPHARYR